VVVTGRVPRSPTRRPPDPSDENSSSA
jgi:hypothetical protein